jgi:hypothetical protein
MKTTFLHNTAIAVTVAALHFFAGAYPDPGRAALLFLAVWTVLNFSTLLDALKTAEPEARKAGRAVGHFTLATVKGLAFLLTVGAALVLTGAGLFVLLSHPNPFPVGLGLAGLVTVGAFVGHNFSVGNDFVVLFGAPRETLRDAFLRGYASTRAAAQDVQENEWPGLPFPKLVLEPKPSARPAEKKVSPDALRMRAYRERLKAGGLKYGTATKEKEYGKKTGHARKSPTKSDSSAAGDARPRTARRADVRLNPAEV